MARRLLAPLLVVLLLLGPLSRGAPAEEGDTGGLVGVASGSQRLAVDCSGRIGVDADGSAWVESSGGCAGRLSVSLGGGWFATSGASPPGRLDLVSGVFSPIEDHDAPGGILWALGASDPEGGRFFVVDRALRVVTHDMLGAGTTRSAPLPFSPLGLEHDPADGALYAHAFVAGELRLFRIDPASGASEAVALLARGGSVLYGLSAFDAAKREYYWFGNGPALHGLHRVGVASGPAPAVPVPMVPHTLETRVKAMDFHDGFLVLLVPVGGGFSVYTMDPATGRMLIGAGFPDVRLVHWGVGAVGPEGTFAFVGESFESSARRVHAIHLPTRTKTTSPPLAQAMASLGFSG